MGLRIRQLSKKDHYKKKKYHPEEGHFEGKHWCNCKTRNIRRWFGLKKYGMIDEERHQHRSSP
jgi:hypothetical protein